MRRSGVLVAVLLLAGASACAGDDGSASTPPADAVTSSTSPFAADDPPSTSEPELAVRTPLPPFGETEITITSPTGDRVCSCVLVADRAELRQRGLMEVADLGGYDGMLFVFDTDVQTGFYMRNTPMPLSIAWFAADGAYVSEADMEPCADKPGCPSYGATGSYRFAVEVPQGELADIGAVPGSDLAVTGACDDAAA